VGGLWVGGWVSEWVGGWMGFEVSGRIWGAHGQ